MTPTNPRCLRNVTCVLSRMVNITSCHHRHTVREGNVGTVDLNSQGFKPKQGIATNQIDIGQIHSTF